MVFEERKIGQEYEYKTEGVFGSMVFVSPARLDADKLDAIFVGVLGAKSPKGTVGPVKFEFAMRPAWDDDEDENIDEVSNEESKAGIIKSFVNRIIELWRKINKNKMIK